MSFVDLEGIVWDDLIGYSPVDTSHVENVLDTVVKLENGDVFRCDESVEGTIDIGDFCVVFEQRWSTEICKAEIAEKRRELAGSGSQYGQNQVEILQSIIAQKEKFLEFVQNNGGQITFRKLLIGDHIIDTE